MHNMLDKCPLRNLIMGMATVKDLESVFGAEPRLTPGAVRQLTRVCQATLESHHGLGAIGEKSFQAFP